MQKVHDSFQVPGSNHLVTNENATNVSYKDSWAISLIIEPHQLE